jgi:hypothetical protein
VQIDVVFDGEDHFRFGFVRGLRLVFVRHLNRR